MDGDKRSDDEDRDTDGDKEGLLDEVSYVAPEVPWVEERTDDKRKKE
jgi:hypothetical protein